MSLPDVLQSAAMLVMACAFFVLAVRGFRRLEARIGQVHVVADAVNHAVNNVGKDSPTLRQVIVDIDGKLDQHITDTTVRMDQIEDLITRPRGIA